MAHIAAPSDPAELSLPLIGVALDGCGWHPAAWREADAEPDALFTARYWTGLVHRAEAGRLDFVTFEDGLRFQSDHPFRPDDRTDRVRGRLDAVLIAARVAPTTTGIGLIPSVTVTHTEPFHISKAIATLDYVSGGRAGVRIQVSARPEEAAHFGRREFPPIDLSAVRSTGDPVIGMMDEAEDYVEVLRRLWDSWEDDAEIRDVASGRFVDREKLHYIDFSGPFFSVRGPSITPRPPQGQPIVAALAHATRPYQLIARRADLGFVTPSDAAHGSRLVDVIDTEAERVGRYRAVRVLGDLVVYLDGSERQAAAARDRLDERAGAPARSDAAVFTGTPTGLADLVEEWAAAGLAGLRLRPGRLPHDLDAIVSGLIPELQRRGRFPTEYEPGLFRSRLGMGRPASRYARA